MNNKINDLANMTQAEKRALLEKIIRDKASTKNQKLSITPKEFEIPEYFTQLQKQHAKLEELVSHNIYFQTCEGINSDITSIDGKEFINFSSYNYIGLSGHPMVNKAAKEAIDKYGTSVSASRLASGERPLHRELERSIANFIGTEDCLTFVGGYITNESVIGHICDSEDLILYDSLIHASIQTGCKLSGATIKAFPHNNHEALNQILIDNRSKYNQVLIVIEGVYSMDGDLPNLPEIIDIKKRHKAMLLVDEAHSIGVLGDRGAGISEYYSVNPNEVEFWMGTLSKSLASCGGYIAAKTETIEYLKYTAPGFVYSVGMTPANTAASIAAIDILKNEPERIQQLHQNARLFLKLANEIGLNTGKSKHSAVIPVIFENSKQCVQMYKALYENGIFALPITYPTVAENASRIRFFISSTHTVEQINKTILIMAENIAHLT